MLRNNVSIGILCPPRRLSIAMERGKSADKPGSVEDSHSSWHRVTPMLQQPTRRQREPRYCPLCGLAPDGVYPAAHVAMRAVRSYRTFSPLPRTHRPSSRGQGAAQGRDLPLTSMRDFAPLRRQSQVRTLGCVFSVALSVASRRPVVNRHPALWSPDFPLRTHDAQRLSSRLPAAKVTMRSPSPVPPEL